MSALVEHVSRGGMRRYVVRCLKCGATGAEQLDDVWARALANRHSC